ncbi:SDR family oxidoreductase [Salinarchaeum laminariae]|uniref:SDR family oxidoreductase n=1 Tax=Salinarchaeum laminariae TaxID=869888 RepID=UPI0020BE02C2|nr:SDR family oxidoreductase [Salinarchaeum laminariae]
MPRTAVVTGASSGIGEATAHELADEGLDIALAARREERLESIAGDLEEEYGVDAVAVPTDVRDEAAVDALIEATVERFGGLDVLVNNAGLARGGEVAELETEQYRTMTETNEDGVFFATRAALPHLVESEGHLVFVGSFAGQYPRPFNPVYAATKWWVRGFAHSVGAQVGDQGVAVSVVNPSEVRTEFGGAEGASFAERFERGSVTEPIEIAEAIRFAATRERSGVSEIDLFRRDKFADTMN